MSKSKQRGVGPVRPQGGKPRKGEQRAHVDERRARVESLELAGASLRRIGELVEVDKRTVQRDLEVIRERRRTEAAGCDLDERRDLELARLEQQRSQLAELARAGDPETHRVLIRIADRTSKLLGLDAPQQVALSGEVRSTLATGVSASELAELLADADD